MLFVNRESLQEMFIENQLLVVYTPFLKAFYQTCTKLVCSTHYLINVIGHAVTDKCSIHN